MKTLFFVCLLASALSLAPPAPAAGLADLHRRDIFGLAPPPPPPSAPPGPAIIAPLPDIRGPDDLFTLVGFVAVVPGAGAEGLAVFLDKNTRQEGFYRPGDRIGGFRVLVIGEDGVTVESPLGDRYLVREGAAHLVSGTPRTAAYRVRLDLLLEQLAARPGDLAGLSAESEYRDGAFAGRRVAGVETVELLYNLGLRSGDLVTALDGAPLEDPAALPAFYRGLLAGGAREVRLYLLRDGRPHRLVYYLE